MKVKAAVSFFLVIAFATAQQWQTAVSDYHYQFPQDHFDHPQYQTEWWYYTGNVQASDGHRFGFELTFFRQAASIDRAVRVSPVWRVNQIYLAHLALSDISGHEFYYTQRLNRGGPGLAGISLQDKRYWNGNWQVHWLDVTSGHQGLEAICDRFHLQLDLSPEKPPIVHGHNGINKKGPLPGEASHYISLTRLQTKGSLRWKNKTYTLTGLAWMDHEFFTQPTDNAFLGWNWFSIQLNNHEELMLYRIRRNSEEKDNFSSGTYIDAVGRVRHLEASDFTVTPQEWHRGTSGHVYPIKWNIKIPCLQIELSQRTEVKNQELFAKNSIWPNYWEGAVTYNGLKQGKVISGVGYLEMTGYSGIVKLGSP